jgi:hypothetical protein
MAVSDLTTAQHERTQFVRCNTIGHAWFDYPSSDWVPQFGDPLVLRCERCGTERRDSIGAHGQILARSYDHPDGYKYGRGEKPSRAEFRRMLLDQQIREAREARRKK